MRIYSVTLTDFCQLSLNFCKFSVLYKLTNFPFGHCLIMSRPHRAEALSDDARLTSVAYIGPESRTERPGKTKIGTEVAHVAHDSDTTFKVKMSKSTCRGRSYIVAASSTACFRRCVCLGEIAVKTKQNLRNMKTWTFSITELSVKLGSCFSSHARSCRRCKLGTFWARLV